MEREKNGEKNKKEMLLDVAQQFAFIYEVLGLIPSTAHTQEEKNRRGSIP